MNNIGMQLFLILILIIINAFFSSAEMAIISLNKNKLNTIIDDATEENSSTNKVKKAKILLKLLKEPSKFLATIQVGITLAGFLASASAATSISKYIEIFFKRLNIPKSSSVALFLTTLLLSYLTLVFGELLPKRIALGNSEKIALFSIKPIIIFMKISLPFVNILTYSTNFLLKILGIDYKNIEEKISEEEIKKMIDLGEETGVFNSTEKEMINSIFDFDNTLAKEIMTPRTSVFAMDINDSPKRLINNMLEERYSRVPLYEDDIDNIIGILHIKDMFSIINKQNIKKEDLINILRAPYFIPETKAIDSLFKEMQTNKSYISILIDEYGGFSGIVTMEDLIEEVMGNISDEYDEDNTEEIIKINANTFLLDASITIDNLNEKLNLELPSENFDTLGGFILDITGAIPKCNVSSQIEYNNLIFKIEKVSNNKIEKIKLYISE
ncbi:MULTISPECIES: hemolysin family protein [Clostridium]|uniref:HlyC/CorC family transporter n=1 Tax=Clostridium sporogenes TaxID=1509 RepID=A0ABX4K2A4_CLOSG|nr:MULTISPECIES: hemolysin family protein [Clostridium]MBE6057912.1 HlyC/CorC family transporter [Clostridium sp.]NFF63675.1 HlyC/CorC family transporter [Clostridium sporogenes]NFH48588.1 HlyC/CorC family transporter [Clostridium sporogenes]NFQ00710.1 HlyC/CorC family transporter [Clostridium sporogenes]NFQ40634.1 HlyC/CorC family transporter [Clostridium sporogenes]